MPPRSLILYAEQPDESTLRALAVDLLSRNQQVPGAVALLALAEGFAATWCELTGIKLRVLMRERLYQ
jgi:hypothetical protein